MTRFNNNFLTNANWQEPEPMRPRSTAKMGGMIYLAALLIAAAYAAYELGRWLF